MKDFGLYKGIIALENHFGYTRRRLAGELNVSEGTIYSIVSLKKKASTIVERAIAARFPDISMDYILFQKGELFTYGNKLRLHKIGNDNYALKVPSIKDSKVAEEVPIYNINDTALTITNNAMAPILETGDKVITQKLNSIIDIKSDAIYVVRTKEMGAIARRLRFLSEDNLFVLTPENPTYEVMKIPASSILDVWSIRNITKVL